MAAIAGTEKLLHWLRSKVCLGWYLISTEARNAQYKNKARVQTVLLSQLPAMRCRNILSLSGIAAVSPRGLFSNKTLLFKLCKCLASRADGLTSVFPAANSI